MPLKDDKETEHTVVKNEDIHENDVLMGRGGKNNRHVGNEKLRDIARGHVDKYKVSTKKIKSAISRDIVKQVRSLDPEGRFLKRVAETGEWEDVGDYLAREKVAQVLRDAVCEATEATRPSIHPAMYTSAAPPYLRYPDGRAAAGVFRQGPIPGMEPMAVDGEARRTAIPGVVTASASSSFGHPAGYPMPHPWHPYSPAHPIQPYPGMYPFPPGFHPHHPGASAAHAASAAAAHVAYIPGAHAASAAAAHVAYIPGRHAPTPHRTTPPEDSSTATATPTASSTQQTPTTRSQGTSAFGPAYSISLSVAATAPPTMWHPPGYATPMQANGKRKRSQSEPLPETRVDKSPPPSEGSSSVSKTSPTKKTSATQTPTFAVDFDPMGASRPSPMTSQSHPAQWAAGTQPTIAFPLGSHPTSQERIYFEQHSQHYYEQSATFRARPQPQPPIRSFSAPLPQALARGVGDLKDRSFSAPPPQALAGGVGDRKDSDSSTGSIVQRSRHASFSARKAPKRIMRPTSASTRNFETLTQQEQPGGSGTMEPLPAQQEEEAIKPAETEPTAQNPARERSSRSSSRRSGRANLPSDSTGASEAELGLDWFQGELLLESDEDESQSREENKDGYGV